MAVQLGKYTKNGLSVNFIVYKLYLNKTLEENGYITNAWMIESTLWTPIYRRRVTTMTYMQQDKC